MAQTAFAYHIAVASKSCSLVVMRPEREKLKYDEGTLGQRRVWWKRRLDHIFRGPNSQRAAQLYMDLLLRGAKEGSAFEIGCGNGGVAEQLVKAGAAYVLATDVSETQIQRASPRAVPGRLDFSVMDAGTPVQGSYKLIYGRAVLHHIDFRPVVLDLFEHNLEPGGAMVFYEPLGSNIITKIYARLTQHLHSEDEKPLDRNDIAWFEDNFRQFWYHPVNLTSVPVGALTSLLLPNEDNPLTRWADRLDVSMAKRFPNMKPYYRAGIFVVEKER